MQCCRAWWDGGGMGVASREPKHALNAAKYCTSMAVVALSFVPGAERAWVAVSVLSTIYTFVWDVLMDWGHPAVLDLRDRRAREHERYRLAWQQEDRLRRGAELLEASEPARLPSHWDDRKYPAWLYHVAVGTNGLARMGWAILISPGQQVVQQHVILILGCVELLRRAQWALLRLEWEQLGREQRAKEAAALREAAVLRREVEHKFALHRKPGII